MAAGNAAARRAARYEERADVGAERTPAGRANRQFDYAIASRGFHERVKVRALNRADEWGPSDHCRLMIEVDAG